MARFQAQTNAVLDRTLDEVREALGLTSAQKAELLREIAGLAAWVVRQARAGRDVVAEGPDGREVLDAPALAFARDRPPALALSAEEVAALAQVLAEPPSPRWLDTVARALDVHAPAPVVRFGE